MFIKTSKTAALAAAVSLASNSIALATPPAGQATGPAAITIQSPIQGPDALIRVGSHSMQNGACFYTRYDYRGDKICYAMGEFKRLPYAIKNHFRSIKLLGYGRVDLCSRKNLRGNCTTIYESVRRLPKALANTTYSLEIYKGDGRGYSNNGGYGNYGNGGGYGGGGGGYDDRDRDGY